MNTQPILRLVSLAALTVSTLSSQALAQTPAPPSTAEHSLVSSPANSLRIFDDGHGPIARLTDRARFATAIPLAMPRQRRGRAR